MKKLMLALCVLAVLIVGVFSLLSLGSGNGWTTDSEEAARQLDAAIEAEQKFYVGEAEEHLRAALEADPDLLVAKALLAEHRGWQDKEAWKRLVADLESADLEPLTDRERFLVRYHLAMIKGESERIPELLDRYSDTLPNDPFVVAARAAAAWARNDWDVAEPLYRRLLEIEPNWVVVYNQLGYIEMARGRFEASEEMFMKYRFIAPDQANPHDSLGELYLLLGRHEEARAEFEAALEARPDFCASYEHLLTTALSECDWEQGEAVIERMRAENGCPDSYATMFECVLNLWRAVEEETWDVGWAFFTERCRGTKKLQAGLVVPAFIIALESGRTEAANEIELRAHEMAERPWQHRMYEDIVRGSAEYITAYRLAREGNLPAAIEQLRSIDERISYQGCQLGRFKLMVRLTLARALELNGEEEAARRLVARVAEVNSWLAEQYRADPTHWLPKS